MKNSNNITRKCKVFNIKYETDGCKIDLPQELFIELSLESDEINDCGYIAEMLSDEISNKTGYLHNGFDFEDVKEKQKVYIVMIDDVCFGGSGIQDCTVWSLKEKAIAQLKTVADSYKADPCAEYLNADRIGFDENTSKDYVMTESEEHFTFYKNGYYSEDHIEVWILEKEIN